MKVSNSDTGLSAWLTRLRDCEMPVFGKTVHALKSVVESKNSSANALAQVILQDAAMTAKVLKLANSVWFNPSRQSVSTVSRAIVMLGFEVVSQIALSVALVDQLISGQRHERVARLMACSFHAAVQARAIAQRRHDPQPEEIFVAALLLNIGELAFWCFSGSAGDVLEAALQGATIGEESVQMQVLGFKLRHLTVSLAQDWRLGPMVKTLAEGHYTENSREQIVALAWHLARAVDGGWETERANRAVRAISSYLGEAPEQVLPMLGEFAQEATRVASLYGATHAAALIPVLPVRCDLQGVANLKHQPDPLLQLKILRDLSLLVASRPPINDVLQMVVEGIYRGAATDRVVLAMLGAPADDPQRTYLLPRSMLGLQAQDLKAIFTQPMTQLDPLCAAVLSERKGCRISNVIETEPQRWQQSQALREKLGTSSFVVLPLLADQRVIGLVYADRLPNRSADAQPVAITEEDFDAIQHFVQQAGYMLELLAARAGNNMRAARNTASSSE